MVRCRGWRWRVSDLTLTIHTARLMNKLICFDFVPVQGALCLFAERSAGRYEVRLYRGRIRVQDVAKRYTLAICRSDML